MIDRLLKTHLEPIARDYRRWQLSRGLAWCWAALTLVGVGFLLVRQLAGWSFPFVFPLLVLAAIVAALILWRRNSRDRFDYRVIARQIEEQDPKLHALLLTAIEQQPDRATGELTYLQQRVIGEALAYRHKHLWGQRASVRLFYAQCAHLTTLALLVAVLSRLYVTTPAGQSFFSARTEGVTVTPGDASVERGSSLVVLVRFDGKVPAEATLVIRPANQNERRVALTKNLDDPVFGTSVPEINAELTYHIEYGARETRDFKVSVFEYPTLERADAKLTFPEYTALPEKAIEDTRRISAVEGTALEYTFHLNKPVTSATLVAKDKSTISLLADTNRPNVYQTGFKLDQSQRYDLVLVDDADRTNKVPPQFVIDVLKNRAPELKFAFPRGDQRVSPLEEIAFQAEVSDDFGLRAYGLAYNLAGEETRFIELGQSVAPQEKRQLRHLLSLEDLDAHPDQLLSYYIWADDVAPDGQVRRTSSDMFFAEVRPFEEIFREGQSPEGGAAAAGAQGNRSEKLAELQKQIINATWKLRRQETGGTPSAQYKKDAPVVQEAQENALDQVRELKEEIDDPRSRALVETVETEMDKAVRHLTDAVDKNSVEPLPPALSAEQSAYQALLRLASREYQVSRGRNQQGGRGGGQRAQRQLDQLELKQTENRYETQRQASPQQNTEQREQMQVFNRLKELAQRQQDLNERLKELQTALQEAKTEQEREEIRRRLKRLREEQQEMLADMDELNQRMSSPENQSRMAEARQQLEQTRSEVQRATESMENGQVSQALSSGTRAQRELQQLRDDFRKKNSSQFADDMRELRDDARELAQKEEEIGQKLDSLNDSLNDSKRKTLTDSEERQELASQLDEQKKRMDEVIDHATQVTQQAEPVEPLLSKQLYDTLRKATQDEARNLQETTEDLLQQKRLYRPVYEKLQEAKGSSKKSVEVTADLLREGFTSEANQLEQRARKSINDLKSGVERAAESVLGDDTEALRLAKRELEALSQQLEKELARAGAEQGQAAAGAPTQRGTRDGLQRAGERADEQTNEPTPAGRRDGENPSTQQTASTQGEQQGRSGERSTPQDQQGQATNGRSPERQTQTPENASGSPSPGGAQASQSQAGNSQQQSPSANSQQNGNGGPSEAASNDGQAQRGQNNGRRNFFDGGNGNDGGGTGGWEGPILGSEYTQWSDRLRDVEEMLDEPELRTQAARIRDRARAMRIEYKRHSKEPKWDLVKLEIAAPLAELRSRVAEALARRESNEAIVPIDRDPVPTRYSELVRRYYEQLGKSESGAPADPGVR